jgi:hypothetical protein
VQPLDEQTNRAIHDRWRLRLAVAIMVLSLIAAAATLGPLLYPDSGGSWVIPALLWAGVGCVVMAWRTVPRGIDPAERPAMGRTARWIVLAVLVAFVVPVVLVNVGVVGFD